MAWRRLQHRSGSSAIIAGLRDAPGSQLMDGTGAFIADGEHLHFPRRRGAEADSSRMSFRSGLSGVVRRTQHGWGPRAVAEISRGARITCSA
jgi:hypothetical protein